MYGEMSLAVIMKKGTDILCSLQKFAIHVQVYRYTSHGLCVQYASQFAGKCPFAKEEIYDLKCMWKYEHCMKKNCSLSRKIECKIAYIYVQHMYMIVLVQYVKKFWKLTFSTWMQTSILASSLTRREEALNMLFGISDFSRLRMCSWSTYATWIKF